MWQRARWRYQQRQELVDLVLFTVKSYDTKSVANQIKPCLGSNTVVLTLQNGVGNAEKIGEIVGIERVMAGAGYIVAGIESPGVIKHATAGRIAFGELDGSDTARGRAIAAACQKSGNSGRVFAEHPQAPLGKVCSDLRPRDDGECPPRDRTNPHLPGKPPDAPDGLRGGDSACRRVGNSVGRWRRGLAYEGHRRFAAGIPGPHSLTIYPWESASRWRGSRGRSSGSANATECRPR